MRKYLLLSALVISLTACLKTEDENEVTPAAINTIFDQDFNLNYRQQATLSSASQTELTVAVEELHYTFCPKNANCFIGDFVNPTMSVTDTKGQTQEVKLSMHRATSNYPNWMDTISVRANGTRYLLYYKKYDVKAGCDNPAKKDISVQLRITKPTNN
ncbi:hypothetical protein [Hymenobacter sp. YC55]|uniref:hypothetical protein n=1 Tax=Hymenobacter sp. YC55 TaxID=3034019 RepID=UPI0023F6F826|nr:hypothetical protein [Hymenobacter sp. YC55]MDF7812029.1 hypothetical protein [Hymenobacter sp. YC55]